MSRNQEIAKIILAQMGGNKLRVMVGAKDFIAIESGLQFRFMRSNGINMVRVVLDEGADLYNMEFISMHGGSIKQKAYHEGVYFDQLTSIFEKETGLYTSL